MNDNIAQKEMKNQDSRIDILFHFVVWDSISRYTEDKDETKN